MSFAHNQRFNGLLAAACLLFPMAALGASPATHARYAGTYASNSASDAKPGPSMDVSLGLDGTATVTEDAGSGTVTHFGHWAETDNQVTVSFDAVDGKPADPPMTFLAEHDELRAISWNHSTWG